MAKPLRDLHDVELAALSAAGASAVLSGHVHDPFDIERGGVRLIGAGTLSTRLRQTPPSFNEIRVAGGSFDTIVRTLPGIALGAAPP